MKSGAFRSATPGSPKKKKETLKGSVTQMLEGYKKQTFLLLDYLLEHGSITGMECVNDLGVMNYKGRIADLRKQGYIIDTEWEDGKNRYGRKVRYARYVLVR